MAKEITSFRAPDGLIDRAEALIDAVAHDPKYAQLFAREISRSDVLRIALLIGIESLERKYSKKDG